MALINLLGIAAALMTLQPDAPLQPQPPKSGQEYVRAFHAAPRDKAGRITISCFVDTTSVDPQEFLGMKDALVLSAPKPKVTHEDALKQPELRDRVEVRLAPAVVEKLKKQGIKDVDAHFRGKTVRATGRAESTIYLCFPAMAVYTVVVEHVEDIKILPDNAPNKP